MKLKYYDNKGKEASKEINVSDAVWSVEPNQALISQYVYSYLSNQRQATAKSKDRSEVSGGGRKPWKQKGTGRARVGSNRSPIWRGGGVTFGPTGEQNYKKQMNKKMKKSAMRTALSMKSAEGKVIVAETPVFSKTNEAADYIKQLPASRKTLVVQSSDENVHRALRNVSNVKVVRVNELNAYQVLNSDLIVFIENTLPTVEQFWS